MTKYSLQWPHSNIKQIFPNIFFVMGTNITEYEGITLQHSRNMIIIQDQDKLSLINTVKLNQQGLDELDALGTVENVIRLGSFHGRDDDFYLDHYNAKLWALPNMEHKNNRKADFILSADGIMPFSNCKLFTLASSKFPEAILHIDQDGGILVTCDSIKNWLAKDEFFSDKTASLYEKQNFFGCATITEIWLQATQVKKSELLNLLNLDFRHLLSAHGAPLLNDAYEQVSRTLSQISDLS